MSIKWPNTHTHTHTQWAACWATRATNWYRNWNLWLFECETADGLRWVAVVNIYVCTYVSMFACMHIKFIWRFSAIQFFILRICFLFKEAKRSVLVSVKSHLRLQQQLNTIHTAHTYFLSSCTFASYVFCNYYYFTTILISSLWIDFDFSIFVVKPFIPTYYIYIQTDS